MKQYRITNISSQPILLAVSNNGTISTVRVDYRSNNNFVYTDRIFDGYISLEKKFIIRIEELPTKKSPRKATTDTAEDSSDADKIRLT